MGVVMMEEWRYLGVVAVCPFECYAGELEVFFEGDVVGHVESFVDGGELIAGIDGLQTEGRPADFARL